MSHTETHIGKLRKVETGGMTTERWCKEFLRSRGEEPGEYWRDDFWDTDNNHDKYVFYKDDLYETFEHKKLDSDDDIDILTDNGDGTYNFIMQFYNGGTCLQECLQGGLKRLEKEKI